MKSAKLRIGALNGATVPTATTCGASLGNYQQCQAVCADGLTVAGHIQCLDGILVGSSVCGSTKGSVLVKEVKAVLGAFNLKASGKLDAGGMKGALGDALGQDGSSGKKVTASDLTVAWTRTQSDVRRLTAGQSSCDYSQPQATYSSRYEVFVNPAGPSSSSISKRAADLSVPGSGANSAFTSKLGAGGVCVDTIITIMAPRTVMQEVFVSATGEVLAVELPIDSNPEIGSPPLKAQGTVSLQDAIKKEEYGSNAAAIVGGVVGALFGFIIILGCLYYFLVMRKMAEA